MTYVRMYETEQQARDAVRKLKEDGFPEDTILLVTPGPGGAGSVEGISAAISAGFVVSGDAKVYVQAVERGRSLVLVRAAFGFGQAALNILDSCGPVDSELMGRVKAAPTSERGAPLSSFFQWPLLKRNQPAPFSDFLGIPLLSSSTGSKPSLVGEMSASTFDLSFGFRLLSNRAVPLSTLLGLPTLLDTASLGSSSLGFPLLADSSVPKQSTFGLPLLIDRYALI